MRPNGTNVGETILASSVVGNCSAPKGNVVDGGDNISDDKTCHFANTVGANGKTLGDGVTPNLDPLGLRDNGGPTETIAEQQNSPSVDAVPVATFAA